MQKVIDLRSDTLTKPSDGMRRAIADAVVGDSMYTEDPTVIELESYAAKIMGKEAAIFVPSGTMSNLVAVMSHTWERGAEILLGDCSHIHINEQGNIGTIAHVHSRTLTNKSDGTFSIDELVSKIRYNVDSLYPNTALICIENTHNICNGTPLPLEFIDRVCEIAKCNGIAVHMDGARIFNASLKTGVSVDRIIKNCDSLSFCLSKGLGCPIGSVLVGSKPFIQRAIRARRVLGGGMRQAGVLAAAGLFALKHNIERLHLDHKHAFMIASAIANQNKSFIRIDMKNIHTNIGYIDVDPKWMTASQFTARLNTITNEEKIEFGERCVAVKMGFKTPTKIRFVTHLDITYEDTLLLIEKLNFVINNVNKL